MTPEPRNEPPADSPDAEREARREGRRAERRPGVMIPSRRKRLPLEAPLMRLIATAGIVAIAVVVAAIMGSQDSEAWLIGLVVSIVSLVLAALLWSSQRL
jgi:peptidoglycan/LPS O-acetylase OafA/YrhL